jgi:hypothetical protein
MPIPQTQTSKPQTQRETPNREPLQALTAVEMAEAAEDSGDRDDLEKSLPPSIPLSLTPRSLCFCACQVVVIPRQSSKPCAYTLHPTPNIPHPTPTPYTLHPTPTPNTLHPTPYTLHPTPHIGRWRQMQTTTKRAINLPSCSSPKETLRFGFGVADD